MAAFQQIASGLDTTWPACFAQDRFRRLFIVTGTGRGKYWDGFTSTADALGITAPASAPTVAAGAAGNPSGTYNCYVRYVDVRDGHSVYSNLSPVGTVTVTSQKIAWSSIAQSSENRCNKIELWRTISTATSSNKLFLVTTLNDGTTSYADDNNSDATMLALEGTSSYMLYTKPDGDPNAMRFVLPPKNMGVIVRFGDRALYAVPRPYSTGTVATNGTTTLTGSGTAWTTDMEGQSIEIDGETAVGTISTVGGATSITLASAAATTASGKSYVIRPTAVQLQQIRYSEQDEFESCPLTWTITVQENVTDLDRITGLIPYGAICIVAMERHLHRLYFYGQPRIDANVSYWKNRGLINQRCWKMHENNDLYLMDEQGPYLIRGGEIVPIGEAILDQWKGTTIDWTNKRWFFVHIDPIEELVYFFVGFTADSSTRPKRAFVWSMRTQQWCPGPDLYPWEVGDIVRVGISNRQRSVMLTENDKHYLLNEGTHDGTAGANTVRGTATAATSTTLSDSGATFPTDCVDATVAIVRGTGKGQLRRISTRNSATQITVSSAWTTTPDTTSQYVIGAIEYSYKTGRFELIPATRDNKQSFRIIFTPTTNNAECYLRRFLNHGTTADNHLDRFDDLDNKGVSWSASDADTIVDLKLARSTLADQRGDQRWEWGGHAGQPHSSYEAEVRWVQMELAGFQGQDAITFHEIQVEGVME